MLYDAVLSTTVYYDIVHMCTVCCVASCRAMSFHVMSCHAGLTRVALCYGVLCFVFVH